MLQKKIHVMFAAVW